MGAGTGIGEFFVSLSVDALSGELTVGNLIQGFGELEVATLAEVGALWAVGVGLARLVDQAVQASLGFEQFSMHTGLSAQQLQHWQIVAEQSHASADDVTSSVENLTKKLANLAIGIPDSALASLQQLGITAFGTGGRLKSAFEILGEVRERLSAVTSDAGQQERILAGLGVSANLRETLLLTQSLFEQRGALAHGMTSQQEADFDRLRQKFVEIKLEAHDIGLAIAGWITPAITKSLGAVEDIFRLIHDLAGPIQDPKALAKSRGHSGIDFADSVLGQMILTPAAPRTAEKQTIFERLLLPEIPAAAGAGARVTVDKHDTYIIHDAHDPTKVRAVIEQSWDDVLGRKTIDGFDRQNGNGGY